MHDERAANRSAWANPVASHRQDAVVYDEGLRSYMLGVYNWMASGLALTGIVAWMVASVPAVREMFWTVGRTASGHVSAAPTMLGLIAMFAPLAFVLVLSFGVNRLSKTSAQALFWAFCAVMGASLSNVMLKFTGASVASTFFATAGMYAGVSLYGYTTKADLTRMGGFMMMGLIGLILASIVNFFMQSSALAFALSVIGVVVFVGLTAYDTQRIKADYIEHAGHEGLEGAAKRTVFDALSLYLNFVNLFQMMLNFLGVRAGGND